MPRRTTALVCSKLLIQWAQFFIGHLTGSSRAEILRTVFDQADDNFRLRVCTVFVHFSVDRFVVLFAQWPEDIGLNVMGGMTERLMVLVESLSHCAR